MKTTENVLKGSFLVGSVLCLSQVDAQAAEAMFSYENIGSASSVRSVLNGNVSGGTASLELGCGAKSKDHKCGEGKCGDKKSKSKDHKCGEGKCGDKKSKSKDHKCEKDKCCDKKSKSKDHKCGEGKCGDKKSKSKSKSGEGKCGESTCGGAL